MTTPSLFATPRCLAALLALAANTLPAQLEAAELRGRVTDSATGASLVEASVTLTPTGPGAALVKTTDLFGRYEFTAVPAGSFTLGAVHPGYVPLTEPRTFAGADLALRDIPLVPISPGTPRIDVLIQVFDTMTMTPLASVPVRLQRFAAGAPGVLEETLTRTSDALGRVSLRSQPKGHYAFRFNDPADGTPKGFYTKLDNGVKHSLEKHHSVVAQLLPLKQEVKVRVIGPDPRDLAGGPLPMPEVDVELFPITPGSTPPPGFNPLTDDPRDFFVPVMPVMQGRTDSAGEFVFKNLPPAAYIVTGKKPGYKLMHSFFGPSPAGALPALHIHGMALDPRTGIEVVVSSAYGRPDLLIGLPVKLQGIVGSATAGIERESIVMMLPPSATNPAGGVGVFFGMLLPGRYRLSVDHVISSPPVPALEEILVPFLMRFRGEDYFEAPLAQTTLRSLTLTPVPAKIRGRFFVADERETLDLPLEVGVVAPLDRWSGPAYRLAAQGGIEFKESALADFLPPSLSVVSVEAAEDGSFSLTVLPGMWGVSIPTLDGYWGSNYRSYNVATGEEVALGWPYATDPAASGFIPDHPFGSLGMMVNSGDDLELELFVRKQTYYLNGTIVVDPESVATDRVLARTGTTNLLVNHSHIAATGEVEFDENGALPPVATTFGLSQSVSVGPGGVRDPGAGATFLIPAPRGSHKVTVRKKSSLGLTHYAYSSGGIATFTLPDYGFPGKGGFSPDDVIPLERVWEKLTGVPDPYAADYQNEHTVAMRFFGKDQNGMRDLRATRDRPHYVHHPDFGTRLFPVGQGEPLKLMNGAWTLFREEQGTWYRGTVTIGPGDPAVVTLDFDLVSEWGGLGGPLGDPPSPAYDFEMEAVNVDDPTQRIGNLTIEFSDATVQTIPSGGSMLLELDGRHESFVPAKILSQGSTTQWNSASGSLASPLYTITTDMTPAVPLVRVTLSMRRGAKVEGRLLARGANGSFQKTEPMPGARLALRNRFGGRIRDLVTKPDGTFVTDPALPRQPIIFVDIAVPGYQPYRARLAANSGVVNGKQLDFTLGDLTLELLPPPFMLRTADTFDRRGSFLVGVRKGKDGSVFGDDPHITMTHHLEADSAVPKPVTLPGFDLPNGVAAVPVEMTLVDRVRTIRVVDPRSFVGNPTAPVPPPEAVPPPGESVVPDPPPPPEAANERVPNPLYPGQVRTWLQSLAGSLPGGGAPVPGKKNLFWVGRTDLPQTALAGGRFRATADGDFSLAALPPGLFQPWLVAETERGAYAMIQFVPLPTDPPSQALFGIAPPKWLGRLADTIGSIGAAMGDSSVGLEAVLTGGYLRLTPQISGDITINSDKTLRYAYTIGAEFEEGITTPGTDLLTLGPGFTGLTLKGQVEVEMNGSQPSLLSLYGEPTLSLTGSASVAVGTERYVPKLARIVGKYTPFGVELKGNVGIQMKTSTAFRAPHQVGGQLQPLQLSLESTATGGVSVPVSFDFTKAASVIPYVGPFISAAGANGNLTAKATVEPAGGAELTRRLTTRFQSETAAVTDLGTPLGWLDPTKLGARRCVISEDFLPLAASYEREGALLLGIKASLEFGADAVVAAIGGKGTIGLKGSKNPTIDLPTLNLEMNRFGDYPPIRRISGEAYAEFEWFARALLLRYGKKTTLPVAKIDRPLNTEEKLFVLPYDEVETSTSQNGSGSATWCGAVPQLVANHPDLSAYAAAASGTTQALAFLDPAAPGGTMRLRVALSPTAGTWSAPVTVATAAGVTGVAIHPRPAGGWVLAWAEIAAGALADFSPSSSLLASASADGLTWSVPVTIASLPVTAFDLKMVPLPASKLGLLWVTTSRGVGASVLDVQGAVLTGSAWGASATLLDEESILGWDAAGPGFAGTGGAQMVIATATGALMAIGWDGVSVAPPAMLLPAGAGARCRVASGAGGTWMAAATLPDGSLTLFKRTGPSPWSPLTLAAAPEAILPNEFALTSVPGGPGGNPHWLLATTEGAGTPDLRFGYFDFAGAWVRLPQLIDTGAPGRYSMPRVVPGSSPGANVLALFENGGEFELRTFATTPTDGVTAADRDGDTLDDLAELPIVDASGSDALKKIAEVTAAADFDGDAFNNGDELAAGTDPTDADSFPGQRVTVAATTANADELGPVPGLIHVIRAGHPATALTVNLNIGGTAANGTDMEAIAATVEFPAGVTAVSVPVQPLVDALAEGDETVALTVLAGPGYALGTGTTAIVTIKDLPLDGWRFVHFTAPELSNNAISGLTADLDSDGLDTLLEYALDNSPKTAGRGDLPLSSVLENAATGQKHLALVYLRRSNDLELVYQVQFSNALGAWTAATAADVEEISVISNGDGTETVVVRDRTPITATQRRFLRLTVARVE